MVPRVAIACLLLACGEREPAQCAPGEDLGDAEHLAALAGWAELPGLGDGTYVHHSSAELEPSDGAILLISGGNRDFNNFVCASADASKEEPDLVPHVYELDACPEDYVQGFVMARFEGEGVLSRLWLALGSQATGGEAGDAVVRLYVDDDPQRVFEFPYAGMLDGSADPVFARPFGAEAVRHVAWYYPVAFDAKLVIAIDRLGPQEFVYHQASAVLEPIGDRDCDLSEVRPAELGPSPTGETSTHAAPGTIALQGPGTIQELVVRGADPDVVMTATFDGHAGWSLPLGDLLSTRLAIPADERSAPLRARDTEVALALPMPFAESAELTFGDGPSFEVDLVVDPALPPEPWGHLEARAAQTVGPHNGRHPIVDITGRGRLAGLCMMLEGHDGGELGLFSGPFNFLEGDPTIRLDGREILGTGTEEIFDGAFYFDEGPHAGPFSQSWGRTRDDAAVPRTASVSACRWHAPLDALDFRESLSMDLEVGPSMPGLLDRYRSVAFVYRSR